MSTIQAAYEAHQSGLKVRVTLYDVEDSTGIRFLVPASQKSLECFFSNEFLLDEDIEDMAYDSTTGEVIPQNQHGWEWLNDIENDDEYKHLVAFGFEII